MDLKYKDGKWYAGEDSVPLPDHYEINHPQHGKVKLDRGNSSYVIQEDNKNPKTPQKEEKPKSSNIFMDFISSLGQSRNPLAREAVQEAAQEESRVDQNTDNKFLNSWIPAISNTLKDDNVERNANIDNYLESVADYTNWRRRYEPSYNPLSGDAKRASLLYELFGSEYAAGKSDELKFSIAQNFINQNIKEGLGEGLTDEQRNFILELDGLHNDDVINRVNPKIMDSFIQNSVLTLYGRKFKEAENDLENYYKSQPFGDSQVTSYLSTYKSATYQIPDFRQRYLNRVNKYREIFNNLSLSKAAQDVEDLSKEDLENQASQFDVIAEQTYGNYNASKSDIINEGIQKSNLDKDQADKFKAILLNKYYNEAQTLGESAAQKNLNEYLQNLKNSSQGFFSWLGDTFYGAGTSLVGTGVKMVAPIAMFNPVSFFVALGKGIYNIPFGDEDETFLSPFVTGFRNALNNSVMQWAEDLESTGMILPSSQEKSKAGERYTEEEIEYLKNIGIIRDTETEQAYKDGIIRKNQGETFGKWITPAGHETDIVSAGAAANIVSVAAQMAAVSGYAKGISWIGTGMRNGAIALTESANIAGKLGESTKFMLGTAKFLDELGVITESVAPTVAALALDWGYAKSAYDTDVTKAASEIFLNPEMMNPDYDGEVAYNPEFLKQASKYAAAHPELREQAESHLRMEVDKRLQTISTNPAMLRQHTLEEWYNIVSNQVISEYAASVIAPKMVEEAKKDASTAAMFTWALTSIPDAALFNTINSVLFSTPETAPAKRLMWDRAKETVKKLPFKTKKSPKFKAPKLSKESQAIESVTRKADGTYAVKATEVSAGTIGRRNLQNVVISGFISNYLQDVAVGLTTGGFNTAWDNYINNEFNPDSTYTTKSVIAGVLMEGLKSTVDKQSIYDGVMGAGAGVITPNFSRKKGVPKAKLFKNTISEDGKAERKLNIVEYLKDIKNVRANFLVTDALGWTGKDDAAKINKERSKYAKTVENWLNNEGGDAYLSAMNHMYDVYKKAADDQADPERINIETMATNAEYIAQLSKATFQSQVEGEKNTNPITDVVLKNLKIHAERGEITLQDIQEAQEIARSNDQSEQEGRTPQELDGKTASIINDINQIIKQSNGQAIEAEDLVKRLNQVTENAQEQLNIYKDYIKHLNRVTPLYKDRGIYDPLIPKVHAQTEAKINAYDRLLKKHQEALKELKAKMVADTPRQASNVRANKLGVYSTIFKSTDEVRQAKTSIDDAIADRKAKLKEALKQKEELEETIRKHQEERLQKKKKGVPVDQKEEKQEQKQLRAVGELVSHLMYGKSTNSENEVDSNIPYTTMALDELTSLSQIYQGILEFKHVINEESTPQERFLTAHDILSLEEDDFLQLMHLYKNYRSDFSEEQLRVFDGFGRETLSTLEDEALKVASYKDMVKQLKIDQALGIENAAYFDTAIQEARENQEKSIYEHQYKDWGKNIESYQEFVQQYERELDAMDAKDPAQKFLQQSGLHRAINKTQLKKYLDHYAEQRRILVEGSTNRKGLQAILEDNFNKLLADKPDEVRDKAIKAGKEILRYLIVNQDKSADNLSGEVKNLADTQLQQLQTYLENRNIDLSEINLQEDVIQPMLTYLEKSEREAKALRDAAQGKHPIKQEVEGVIEKGKIANVTAAVRTALASFVDKESMYNLLRQTGINKSIIDNLQDNQIESLQGIVNSLVQSNNLLESIQSMSSQYADDSVELALLETLQNQIIAAQKTGNINGLLKLNKIFITPSTEAKPLTRSTPVMFTLASYEYHKNAHPESTIVKLYEQYKVLEFLKGNDINSWRKDGKKPQVHFLYNVAEDAKAKEEIQKHLEDSGKNPDDYNKDTSALVAVAVELDSSTIEGEAIEIDGHKYQIIGFLPDQNSMSAGMHNSNLVRESIQTDNNTNGWTLLKDEEGNPYYANFEVKSTTVKDEENFHNIDARREESKILLELEEKEGATSVVPSNRYEVTSNGIIFKRTPTSPSELLITPALSQTVNQQGNTLEDLAESPASIVNFNFLTRRLREKIGAIVDYCRQNPEIQTSVLTPQVNSTNYAEKSEITFTPTREAFEQTKHVPSEEHRVSLQDCLRLKKGYNYLARIENNQLVIEVIQGAKGDVVVDNTRLTIDLGADAETIDAQVGEWIYNLSTLDNIDDQGYMNSLVRWQVSYQSFKPSSATRANGKSVGYIDQGNAQYRTLVFKEGLLQLAPTKHSAVVELEQIRDTNADRAIQQAADETIAKSTYQNAEGDSVEGQSRNSTTPEPTGLRKIRTIINGIIRDNKNLRRRSTPINIVSTASRKGSLAASGEGKVSSINAVLGNVYDDICNNILEGRSTNYENYKNVLTQNEYDTLVQSANTLQSWLKANGMTVVKTQMPLFDYKLRDLMTDSQGNSIFQQNFADLVVMLPDGNLAIIDYKTSQREISPAFYEGYWNALNLYAGYLNNMLSRNSVQAQNGQVAKVTKLYLAEQPLLRRGSQNIFNVSRNETAQTETVTRANEGIPVVNNTCKLSLHPLVLQDANMVQEDIRRRSVLYAHRHGMEISKIKEIYGENIESIIKKDELTAKDMVGKTYTVNMGNNNIMTLQVTEVTDKNKVIGMLQEEGGSKVAFEETLETFENIVKDAQSITELTKNEETAKQEVTEKPQEKTDNNRTIDEEHNSCVIGGSATPKPPKERGGFKGRGNRGSNRASKDAV